MQEWGNLYNPNSKDQKGITVIENKLVGTCKLLTAMPLVDASLNALCTPSSVLISQLELKGQYRCIGLAPTVLSPLSKHVGHEWAPLKLFMLHTKARAIISTEQVSIIPLQIWMPSGVETSSPIRGLRHYT